MLSRSLVLSAVVALSACSEPPPPEKAKVVAPPVVEAPGAKYAVIQEGYGVARAMLGMTAAEVEAQLGKPLDANRQGERVVFMSFRGGEDIFGVYFDDAERVRMVIAAVKDGTWCTAFDVCLYREGDLAKLKAHHGDKLLRFVDRDESITYRLLQTVNGRPVMTEYVPAEAKNGVVQVSVLYWTGPIGKSGFD